MRSVKRLRWARASRGSSAVRDKAVIVSIVQAGRSQPHLDEDGKVDEWRLNLFDLDHSPRARTRESTGTG